jgi:serine-type D-Ala-D-Ala carboxypeptidase/endopeptidase
VSERNKTEFVWQRTLFFCALSLLILLCRQLPVSAAEETPKVQGDYSATLGSLHLKLHIVAAADGRLSGTLDSPDQGSVGIPCTDFQIHGTVLAFSVPAVKGSWQGAIEANGESLAGTWTQASPMRLTFSRDSFVPAKKPSPVDGYWLGTLQVSAQSLRIQLSVKSDIKGQEFCALDSLDQAAFNLPCANVSYSGSDLSFDVPSVLGRWSGKLSADENSLAGTWTQQASAPLTFVRQIAPQRPPPPRQISYDPAIAPVDAADIQAVLGRDLGQTLKTGLLSRADSIGVTVGVLRDGKRRVFAFGAAQPNSIFEIGSITKTFTGLVLAQLIAQGKVTETEPVREFLPAGLIAKPQGAEITLFDLITQHSGLPRMPDNFNPSDPENPYADYRADDLYRFLAKRGVEAHKDAGFLYSNLGVGLLGQALSNRANMSYARLVGEEVTAPLQMRDTVVEMPADKAPRFIQGHSADLKSAKPWDLDALAGAGGLRSTADDMLAYLAANLHPEQLAKSCKAKPSCTLTQALRDSHVLRDFAGAEMRIAFAWLYDPATGTYWHNGATGGYSSFAFFNPKGDYAAVILLNMTLGAKGSFADTLGTHVRQRLAGQAAVGLAEW